MFNHNIKNKQTNKKTNKQQQIYKLNNQYKCSANYLQYNFKMDFTYEYKKKIINTFKITKSNDIERLISKIEYDIANCIVYNEINITHIIYENLNIDGFKYLMKTCRYEIRFIDIKNLLILLSQLHITQSKQIIKKLYFDVSGLKIPFIKIKELAKYNINIENKRKIYNMLLNEIINILFCNKISDSIKLLACEYFSTYILTICRKLCYIDKNFVSRIYNRFLDNHTIGHCGIVNEKYFYILQNITYYDELYHTTNYKININNDIINYYRVIVDKFLEHTTNSQITDPGTRRRFVMSNKFNIFNINEYVEIKHKIIKYIDRNIIFCSRYNNKTMNIILLCAYYYKKHGFKNIIKQIVYYYFN